MGNLIIKRRKRSNPIVKDTPTGIYSTCSWDNKMIKRMIKDYKIAPFYYGKEFKDKDIEMFECPICFLYYPKDLNQTICCRKLVCSDCLLQIIKPIGNIGCCPFCNQERFHTIYIAPPKRKSNKSNKMKNIDKSKEIVLEMKPNHLIKDNINKNIKNNELNISIEDTINEQIICSIPYIPYASIKDREEFHNSLKQLSQNENKAHYDVNTFEINTFNRFSKGENTITVSTMEAEEFMLLEAIKRSLLDTKHHVTITS